MEFPMVNGTNDSDSTSTDAVYSFNGNTLSLNELNIKVTCMVNIYPAPIRSMITVESSIRIISNVKHMSGSSAFCFRMVCVVG